MPIDKRRESRVIAVIFADVVEDSAGAGGRLKPALEQINQLFAPAIAGPL